MNYYRVVTKCGHVGKGRYIIKDFYVMANDGKKAALKVRWFPRVKHHWKDAIEAVYKITDDEYRIGVFKTHTDLYFQMKNSTEQRIFVDIDPDEICKREQPEKKQKDKNFTYYIKTEKIRKRDLKMQLAEVI